MGDELDLGFHPDLGESIALSHPPIPRTQTRAALHWRPVGARALNNKLILQLLLEYFSLFALVCWPE